MRDLISRQAVLEKIEKIRQSAQMMDDTRRASIIMNGMYLCEKAVRSQPSAEPEIIQCKDCRYTDEDGVCQSSKGLAIQDDDDFCSHAERREE